MNLATLTKSQFFEQWLINNIGYYANGMFSFDKQNNLKRTDKAPKLLVVAKQHYSENETSYSSINKSELNELLKLKKESTKLNKSIFKVKANKAIDGFTVKTITFEQALIEYAEKSLLLIPETELLASREVNQLTIAATPVGTLYIGVTNSKVTTAYAQGILASVEAFKLSAGLSTETETKSVEQDKFGQLLFQNLTNIPFAQLHSISLVNMHKLVNGMALHWLYAAPLFTALAFYLITNAYLAFSINNIETQAAANQEKISGLLTSKHQVDVKGNEINLISDEFKGQAAVHNYWAIVGKLIDSGAVITRITYTKGELIIRGSADKASAVLAEINNDEQVKSASFNGPVRNYRDKDVFTIKVVPKDVV